MSTTPLCNPLISPAEHGPATVRPFDHAGRWVVIEVPAHGAAVAMISRLSRRSGFSFAALTAFALHHLAWHGEKLLREESAHARRDGPQPKQPPS